MRKALFLFLVPIAFADTSATITVHVPAIEKFASRADLKKVGVAKLKPAQLDALNDVIDQICLRVANDVAGQIADQLQEDLKEDGPAAKATRIRYARQ